MTEAMIELSRKLKKAFPDTHTAIEVSVDQYSSGREQITWTLWVHAMDINQEYDTFRKLWLHAQLIRNSAKPLRYSDFERENVDG